MSDTKQSTAASASKALDRIEGGQKVLAEVRAARAEGKQHTANTPEMVRQHRADADTVDLSGSGRGGGHGRTGGGDKQHRLHAASPRLLREARACSGATVNSLSPVASATVGLENTSTFAPCPQAPPSAEVWTAIQKHDARVP